MCSILLFIFFSFIYSTEGDCPRGFDRCEWTRWKSWDSCSSSCGGGSRSRSRPACCEADISFDKCMKDCRMDEDDAEETESCNEICYHGRYYYSGCICTSGYSGYCCDIGRP